MKAKKRKIVDLSINSIDKVRIKRTPLYPTGKCFCPLNSANGVEAEFEILHLIIRQPFDDSCDPSF